MAAEVLARAGCEVVVTEQKPSVARKFLMAGKSGLNLTMEAPPEAFIAQYPEMLHDAIRAYGPRDVRGWANSLGAEVFTGSSGRVFPKAMKASPLLRAWLARLDRLNVTLRTRWRWTGWGDDALQFDTPDGMQEMRADITILALGGASWPRLGSDGIWTAQFPKDALAPFAPSNVGARVEWSAHMARHFGTPVKNLALMAGDITSRGEIILSRHGLEGGGIYSLSPALRTGAALRLDLLPDQSPDEITARLARPRGKQTLTNWLRKALRLDPVKIALLMECLHPLPDDLAAHIKALEVPIAGLQGIERAISTSGGLRFDAVDETLMLRARPGCYVAGEMLDWEAPTGGYLLTACLAQGAFAARAALARAGLSQETDA